MNFGRKLLTEREALGDWFPAAPLQSGLIKRPAVSSPPMRVNVQRVQTSKRVVAERLHIDQTASTKGYEGAGARLENPLGVFADRSVEARLKAAWLVGAARSWQLLPDVAEQLANGAQENGLQHLCARSAFSLSPV